MEEIKSTSGKNSSSSSSVSVQEHSHDETVGWLRKPLQLILVSSSTCLVCCLGVTNNTDNFIFWNSWRRQQELLRINSERDTLWKCQVCWALYVVCNISVNTYQVREKTMPLIAIDPPALDKFIKACPRWKCCQWWAAIAKAGCQFPSEFIYSSFQLLIKFSSINSKVNKFQR